MRSVVINSCRNHLPSVHKDSLHCSGDRDHSGAALSPALRCLLVADLIIYQETMATRLRHQPGIQIVGVASCAASAIKACSELQPDLLILDLAQRDLDALLVARAFAVLNPKGRVIILSNDSGRFRQQAEQEPVVVAIIERFRPFHELLKVILSLLPDQSLPRQVPDLNRLTAREREVLYLIGSGFDTQAVADRLRIALRTVSTHRQNIIAKLGLKGHSLVHLATVLVRDCAVAVTWPQDTDPG